jgi:hypothetical protein
MNIFGAIWKGLKKIFSFITSPEAQKAIKISAELVPVALPWVVKLGGIDPEKSKLDDILGYFAKYAVPLTSTYSDDKIQRGNALLNLATELVRRELPEKYRDVGTSIINTAVQLAVASYRAGGNSASSNQ